jgi:hypothetical protein
MIGLAEPGYGAAVRGGDARILWIGGLRLAGNGGEIATATMPEAGNTAITCIADFVRAAGSDVVQQNHIR